MSEFRVGCFVGSLAKASINRKLAPEFHEFVKRVHTVFPKNA